MSPIRRHTRTCSSEAHPEFSRKGLQATARRKRPLVLLALLCALASGGPLRAEEVCLGPSEVLLNGLFTALEAVPSAVFAGQSDHLVSIDTAQSLTLGRLDIGSVINQIEIQGDVAFLAAGNGGLVTVDISSPESLTLLGRVSTGGAASRLAVEGNRAYVLNRFVTGVDDVRVFDISTPDLPTEIGSFSRGSRDLQVVGTTAYVLSTSGFRILDVSDLSSISEIGHWPAGISSPLVGLLVQGDRAYVGVDPGVVALDISDPTTPQEIGRQAQLFGPSHFAALGDRLYVGTTGNYHVLDTASLPDLPIVTRGETLDATGVSGMSILGDVLYLSGLHVRGLDISNPDEIPEVSFFAAPLGRTPVVLGETLYLVFDRLLAFDLGAPGGPRFLNAERDLGQVFLDVQGTRAVSVKFAQTGFSVLTVLEFVPETGEATVLGSSLFPATSRPQDIEIAGTVAYVADNFELTILDFSDPQDIRVLSSTSLSASSFDLEIEDGLLFVEGPLGRVETYDVSNPSAPVEIGPGYEPAGVVRAVVARGDALFLGTALGVELVDYSDASAPLQRNLFATDDPVRHLSAEGTRLFASSGENLSVYDISDPLNPILLLSETTAGDRWGFVRVFDQRVLASKNSGLRLFATCSIFGDDFESGGTSLWSASSP
ncbi:MAG: hypothetical protein AAF725_11460 [Acidobacteriota bacterium]